MGSPSFCGAAAPSTSPTPASPPPPSGGGTTGTQASGQEQDPLPDQDIGDAGNPPYYRSIGNGAFLYITPEDPEGTVMTAAEVRAKQAEQRAAQTGAAGGPPPTDSAPCPADPRCFGGSPAGTPQRPDRAPAPPAPSGAASAPGTLPPPKSSSPPPPPTRTQVEASVAAENQSGSGSAVGAGGYTTGDPGVGPGGTGAQTGGGRQVPLSAAQQQQVVENYFQNKGKTPDFRGIEEKSPGALPVSKSGQIVTGQVKKITDRGLAKDDGPASSESFDGGTVRRERFESWRGTAFFNIPDPDEDSVPGVGAGHRL